MIGNGATNLSALRTSLELRASCISSITTMPGTEGKCASPTNHVTAGGCLRRNTSISIAGIVGQVPQRPCVNVFAFPRVFSQFAGVPSRLVISGRVPIRPQLPSTPRVSAPPVGLGSPICLPPAKIRMAYSARGRCSRAACLWSVRTPTPAAIQEEGAHDCSPFDRISNTLINSIQEIRRRGSDGDSHPFHGLCFRRRTGQTRSRRPRCCIV